MRLLHLDPPVVMSIRKIRRLMRKYGLFCPIRQANQQHPCEFTTALGEKLYKPLLNEYEG